MAKNAVLNYVGCCNMYQKLGTFLGCYSRTSSTYPGFPNSSNLNFLHQWYGTTYRFGIENDVAFLLCHWLISRKTQWKYVKNTVKVCSHSNWERDSGEKEQGTWKTYFLHEVMFFLLRKVFGVQWGISIEIPNVWFPLSMFIKHVQADFKKYSFLNNSY